MMRRRPGPKPVEPLWPHGAIARMVIIPAEQSDTGQVTMGLRKLTVTNATKTDTGWRIVAQSPDKIVRFLDVDEEGIGADCEPWTDELERDLGPADPEHNVVMLEQVQAPPRQAEVIDINAKWAERNAKAEAFMNRVNEVRAPITPRKPATRGRSFAEAGSEAQVDEFRERVARLITNAWSDELREGVKNAESVVGLYSLPREHSSAESANQVDELLTGYEDLIRGLPMPNRPTLNPRTHEERSQALEALAQRAAELIRTFVTDAVVHGVAERREPSPQGAASRLKEAEHHGNA